MNDNLDNNEIIFFSNSCERVMHPFYNKHIVFTGALSTMTRSEAAKKARTCGALIQGAVTKDTHFLILGKNRRDKSTKHLKAEQFMHRGYDIQIIAEEDFMWLISMQKEYVPSTIL
ncbi:BRCT domain-containing protein [Lysinibacillus sp. NPDC097195]|uniref:BRCT domain-containing protein n=1 Tax=Lysinibacillus sp. NPDC097195 TaxID=3364141 RepID=UPI0037F5065D